MVYATNFYLSQILGNKVFLKKRQSTGKLLDLVVDVNDVRPKVIAAKVKINKQIKIVDFSSFSISKSHEDEKYILQCNEFKDMEINNVNAALLMQHILDKQIVDINGRKLVRVNDVRLAAISSGVYVIAVDIGLEGLLRRLGILRPVKQLAKTLGFGISSSLILWDDVQTISSPELDLKLSTTYAKLMTLHPSDLADIIEDLDKKTQAAVFASLDEEKAADVLEELETEAQINVLESLPLEKAAGVLEKMPADEVADILDDMQEEKAEALLSEMEHETSEEIKELMEYPDHTVGSIMSTDFISFQVDLTIEQTLQELRRLKPEPDTIYYLYVIDSKSRLSGVVSLRDLVISEPHTELHRIMNKDVIHVKDFDNINSLVDIISKYSLLAVPVIDEDDILKGVVVINDIVYELLKSKKRKV